MPSCSGTKIDFFSPSGPSERGTRTMPEVTPRLSGWSSRSAVARASNRAVTLTAEDVLSGANVCHGRRSTLLVQNLDLSASPDEDVVSDSSRFVQRRDRAAARGLNAKHRCTANISSTHKGGKSIRVVVDQGAKRSEALSLATRQAVLNLARTRQLAPAYKLGFCTENRGQIKAVSLSCQETSLRVADWTIF